MEGPVAAAGRTPCRPDPAAAAEPPAHGASIYSSWCCHNQSDASSRGRAQRAATPRRILHVAGMPALAGGRRLRGDACAFGAAGPRLSDSLPRATVRPGRLASGRSSGAVLRPARASRRFRPPPAARDKGGRPLSEPAVNPPPPSPQSRVGQPLTAGLVAGPVLRGDTDGGGRPRGGDRLAGRSNRSAPSAARRGSFCHPCSAVRDAAAGAAGAAGKGWRGGGGRADKRKTRSAISLYPFQAGRDPLRSHPPSVRFAHPQPLRAYSRITPESLIVQVF